MTFKFTRILSLALFLLCLALVCTACKPKDPSQGNEEDNPMLTLIENGATAYTVVRPDNCEVVLRTCVTTFVRALKSVSGAETVNVMTDAEDVTALEILVGNTNRPETSEVKARLGQDDYRIEIVNDKPVIVGRGDSAAAFALRLFMQEVVGFRSSSDYDPKEAVTLPLDLCLTGKISNTAADPRNPDDVLIYTVNVLDFGAYGDGTTDDTKAFQSAIDHVYRLGGGTVYAPAGEYLIKGSLTVKRSVYLAGAWSNPDENPGDIKKGTILLATGNKGKADGSAMITIGASAGVMGLTVYYPEQGLVKPGEYPAAILIKDNLAGDGTQHASSVQCVTIVNAWRGIAADKGNQLPRIDNVYISALDYGFKINKCYDCARITSMHIGPDYWAAFTGEDRATVAKQMQQSATGIILMRTDGQMMYDISVDSCQTGLSLDLLKAVHQGIAVHEQPAGCFGNIQVILEELVDGEQRLLIQRIDGVLFEHFGQIDLTQGGRQLIDQAADAQILIVDDALFSLKDSAHFNGSLGFLIGVGQLTQVRYHGADADDGLDEQLVAQGVLDLLGKLFQFLGRGVAGQLLDHSDVGLVNADDEILQLIREHAGQHIHGSYVPSAQLANQEHSSGGIGGKVQLLGPDIDIAGKDVVHDDVLHECAPVVLLFIEDLGIVQGNVSQAAVCTGQFIVTGAEHSVLKLVGAAHDGTEGLLGKGDEGLGGAGDLQSSVGPPLTQQGYIGAGYDTTFCIDHAEGALGYLF